MQVSHEMVSKGCDLDRRNPRFRATQGSVGSMMELHPEANSNIME